MKKIAFILGILILGLGVVIVVGESPPVLGESPPVLGANPNICPHGGDWHKIDGVDAQSVSFTAPEGKVIVESCYKAGQALRYSSYSPGVKSVTLTTNVLNPQGVCCQDISHATFRLADAPVTPTPVTPTATQVTPTATQVTPIATQFTPTATQVTPTVTPTFIPPTPTAIEPTPTAVTPTATTVTPTFEPTPTVATPTVATPTVEITPTEQIEETEEPTATEPPVTPTPIPPTSPPTGSGFGPLGLILGSLGAISLSGFSLWLWTKDRTKIRK